MSLALTEGEKTRILLIAAIPDGTESLKINKEFKEIKRSLNYPDNLELYEILQDNSIEIDDLQKYIIEFKPNIIHFSGHGNNNGIQFVDSRNKRQSIETPSLVRLINQGLPDLNCIILNACLSEKQAEILRSSVNNVIGTNSSISDDAAINFSKGFYLGIANNLSYSESFSLGKTRIGLENKDEENKILIYTNGSQHHTIAHHSKNKILIYITLSLIIFIFTSNFIFIKEITESFQPIVTAAIIFFSLFGINSLEKTNPFISKITAVISKKLTQKKIFALFILTIEIPLVIISTEILSHQISTYIYNENTKKIKESISNGDYSEKTMDLLRKTIELYPYKKDIYEIIALKQNKTRTDMEHNEFRKVSTLLIKSVFTSIPLESNYESLISEAYFFLSPPNEELKFDPISFIMQLYVESISDKDLFTDSDLKNSHLVLEEMINRFGENPERLIYSLMAKTLAIKSDSELEQIKTRLIEILKKSHHNVNIYQGDAYQKGWDYLAQIEIISCQYHPDNKDTHLENINRYYSNILDIRTKVLYEDPSKYYWLSSPKKLSLYWHIVKWNDPVATEISDKQISDTLDNYTKMCPGYEEKLKQALQKFPDFIEKNYRTAWRNGVIKKPE